MIYQTPQSIWLVSGSGFTVGTNPDPTNWNFSIFVTRVGITTAGFYVTGDFIPPADLGVLFHSYTYTESGTGWNPYFGIGYLWISTPRGFYVHAESTSATSQFYSASFIMHCDTFGGNTPALSTQGQAQPAPPYFFNSVSPGFMTDWTKTEFFHTDKAGTPNVNILEFN
jgi:hypothetical protein